MESDLTIVHMNKDNYMLIVCDKSLLTAAESMPMPRWLHGYRLAPVSMISACLQRAAYEEYKCLSISERPVESIELSGSGKPPSDLTRSILEVTACLDRLLSSVNIDHPSPECGVMDEALVAPLHGNRVESIESLLRCPRKVC